MNAQDAELKLKHIILDLEEMSEHGNIRV